MRYTQVRFYTEILYRTKTLLHAITFTHKNRYTQTRLHTHTFTHKLFYTQNTNTFTHNPFSQKHFYTKTLLHTDSFAHKLFYTQSLLHTRMFTQKRLYAKTPLHTNAFTHQRFYKQVYTQTLLHTNSFTPLLHTQTPLSHTPTSTLERKDRGHPNIAILPQFLTLEPHFVRKGCRRTNQTRKKRSVLDTRTSFHAKGLPPDQPNSQKTLSFGHSNLISCERVAAGPTKLAKNPQFWTLEPHFMRKGGRRRRTNQTRKKPSVFYTLTSFRAKGWPFRGASSALPAASREKRKRRETVTEGKREREGERRREKKREGERERDREREREKMRRFEDEKI